MNLRWLPSYTQLRQALRMEPIRFTFGVTDHEPLVHEPGWLTFHFTPDHSIWQTFGQAETGGAPFALEAGATFPAEFADAPRTGVRSNDAKKPLRFRITPIMGLDPRPDLPANQLAAGRYRLDLLMVPQPVDRGGDMDLAISESAADKGKPPVLRIKESIPLRGPVPVLFSREITLETGGALDCQLTPVQGAAVINAAILIPLPEKPPHPQKIPCTVPRPGLSIPLQSALPVPNRLAE